MSKLWARSSVLLAPLLFLPPALSAHKEQPAKYQVGVFLGNEILPDGTYTSDIQCGSGPTYTCTGTSGFNGYRAYYVKTDEGTWKFVTKRQSDDATVRQFGQPALHFTKEKPNLLDALKPGDPVAFRATRDRRIGAGKSMHIFIPRADNPKKEEEFEGTLIPGGQPSAPVNPTDNVKALCASGQLSSAAQEKYCGGPAK
jgi:hypothetical protein